MGNPDDVNSPSQDLRIAMEQDSNYQEIYAEGAFGGITPSGMVHFRLYCDQGPIPTVIHHEINLNGTLGPELVNLREAPDGIARVFKAGITMTPKAAEALARWLDEKVMLIKNQKNEEGENEPSVS
jgi:hypothetical protein